MTFVMKHFSLQVSFAFHFNFPNRMVIFFYFFSELNICWLIVTYFAGENLEKEPRIRELRNQVSWMIIYTLTWNTLMLDFSLTEYHLSRLTVQNYSNYWIGCCSRKIEWTRKEKGRCSEVLLSCISHTSSSR